MRLVRNVVRYQTRRIISRAGPPRPNGLARTAYIRLARVARENDLEGQNLICTIARFFGAVLASRRALGHDVKLRLARQRNGANNEIVATVSLSEVVRCRTASLTEASRKFHALLAQHLGAKEASC